jgi:VIT1/CCC1 family predicted Fe2+/Mn2+ transporter
MQRGLDADLAQQVARQLMAKDALGAHTRDELGIAPVASARPMQAAGSSALAFTIGAGLPLLSAWLSPERYLAPVVGATSLLFLVVLGGLAAYTGGAGILKGIWRVTFWGALAMAITAGVGRLFGVAA